MGKLLAIVLALCIFAGMGLHALFVRIDEYRYACTYDDLFTPTPKIGGDIVTDILMPGDFYRKTGKAWDDTLTQFEPNSMAGVLWQDVEDAAKQK